MLAFKYPLQRFIIKSFNQLNSDKITILLKEEKFIMRCQIFNRCEKKGKLLEKLNVLGGRRIKKSHYI